MGIGPLVRRSLGRYENLAAEAYRERFINLDDLATSLASVHSAKRILEIGCGDGAFADRLCKFFPEAEYLGIDIAPGPGRLFTGDPSRATFRSIPSSELLAERPQPFDLVCIVDVVHHLPEELRLPVLADAVALSAEDGAIAIKDWERSKGPSQAAIWVADRYILGDKGVRFPSREELRGYIDRGLPGWELALETRVPPRRNNVLYVMRPPSRTSV